MTFQTDFRVERAKYNIAIAAKSLMLSETKDELLSNNSNKTTTLQKLRPQIHVIVNKLIILCRKQEGSTNSLPTTLITRPLLEKLKRRLDLGNYSLFLPSTFLRLIQQRSSNTF